MSNITYLHEARRAKPFAGLAKTLCRASETNQIAVERWVSLCFSWQRVWILALLRA